MTASIPKSWYVDEYPAGYKIIQRSQASLERTPILYGSFNSKEEAQKWARENLKIKQKEEYVDLEDFDGVYFDCNSPRDYSDTY